MFVGIPFLVVIRLTYSEIRSFFILGVEWYCFVSGREGSGRRYDTDTDQQRRFCALESIGEEVSYGIPIVVTIINVTIINVTVINGGTCFIIKS